MHNLHLAVLFVTSHANLASGSPICDITFITCIWQFYLWYHMHTFHLAVPYVISHAHLASDCPMWYHMHTLHHLSSA